jgi:hypothetical protein
MNRQEYVVVTVTLEDREDGGLRVYSKDLPGLILSGPDKKEICDLIAPAIKGLLEYKGVHTISVHATRALEDILKHDSPRDVDIHVQQEQFVVELATAA